MLYAGKFEQHHTLSLVPGIVLVVASVVIMFHHHLDKKNPSFTRPTTKERQHTSSDKGFPWRTTRKKWHIFQLHFNFSRAITRASLQEKKYPSFIALFTLLKLCVLRTSILPVGWHVQRKKPHNWCFLSFATQRPRYLEDVSENLISVRTEAEWDSI